MRKHILLTALAITACFHAFSQVDIDKSINLSNSNPADAKITGIKQVNTAHDAVSAEVAQKGSLIYAVAGVTGSTYTVTLTPAITTYTDGMEIRFKAPVNNPAGVQLNVNSVGARNINKNVNINLAANDIVAGQLVSVIYDLTTDAFQLSSRIGQLSNVTASNGLTATGAAAVDVKLGGTLAANTDIATAGNDLTVSGAGKVGIGTGATPVQKLEVNGNTVLHNGGTTYNNPGAGELHVGFALAPSASVGEVSRLALQPYGHTGGPFKFVNRDDAGKAYLDIRYGTTNGLTINSDGNVGIGNQTPGTKLDVAGVVNAATGYQINNAAASGSYLRGNGTNFVSSAIQAADVPTLNQNTTGYATYLKSPFPYNINITDATTAVSLCEPGSLSSVNMHASHGLFANWATTLTMSGYERYGAYQISGNYNSATPELAIRNYVQSSSTWNSWVKVITTANVGSYGDNLGNHTATTNLNMNGRNINSAGDIVSNQNYGLGLVGLYDATKYQNIWSMGAAYRLAANGTGSGSMYGIAYSYNPDYGGAGNNAQSKAGLNHQALYMLNGVTQTAIGTGVWTIGNLRFGNYLLGNDKYAIDATDSWLRLNQQGSFGGTYSPYLIRSDGGFDVDAQTVIDNDGGWHRSYGATGWYNGTYQGGWFMQDATWIRNYNQKRMYYDTDAGDNTESIRVDAQGNTQDHGLICESDGWGLVGYSNQRWYAMYAWAGFSTSSLKYKTDVQELSNAEIDKSLADVKQIQSIRYKWNKSVWEKMNGKFADNKLHEAGEKPDPNYQVPSWLGFSVESLPEGIVDETGENYQYGAMLGLLVSSTKALAKRTEILANALDIDFEKLKTAKSVTKNISDFGTASTAAKGTWIDFSDEFSRQLNGKLPTVTISSSQAGISIAVTEKSSKGFKVISSSDKPVDFDYIAMGKTTVEFPEYASTEAKPMQKTDINAWYTEFTKKNKIIPQQVGNPAEEALLRQKKQTIDPALKGNYVEPVKEIAPPTDDTAPRK